MNLLLKAEIRTTDVLEIGNMFTNVKASSILIAPSANVLN